MATATSQVAGLRGAVHDGLEGLVDLDSERSLSCLVTSVDAEAGKIWRLDAPPSLSNSRIFRASTVNTCSSFCLFSVIKMSFVPYIRWRHMEFTASCLMNSQEKVAI